MRISVKSSRFGDDTTQSHVRNAAKQTSRHAQPMSAFGGKADIAQTSLNVRY